MKHWLLMYTQIIVAGHYDHIPVTRRHGKFTKFNLYQQAGAQEYWIVDPASRPVQVFVLDDGHYAAKAFGTVKSSR